MSAAKLLGMDEGELYNATKRVGKTTFGRLNEKILIHIIQVREF